VRRLFVRVSHALKVGWSMCDCNPDRPPSLSSLLSHLLALCSFHLPLVPSIRLPSVPSCPVSLNLWPEPLARGSGRTGRQSYLALLCSVWVRPDSVCPLLSPLLRTATADSCAAALQQLSDRHRSGQIGTENTSDTSGGHRRKQRECRTKRSVRTGRPPCGPAAGSVTPGGERSALL